jgi:hypothetical protein
MAAAAAAIPAPVGKLQKLVDCVDRTAFDEFVYPPDAERTVFQQAFAPYHCTTTEIVEVPLAGDARWGQRVTATLPWPWSGDFLQWAALRLRPLSWLPAEAERRIGPDQGDWVPTDTPNFYIWTDGLGAAAVERAELELHGVVVEEISGDWINVWNKTAHSATSGIPYDDGLLGIRTAPPTAASRIRVSDDGTVYAPLPFSFARHLNAALPLLSLAGPDTVKIHITLRPLAAVVRKVVAPRACGDDTPVGTSFQIRDYSFPFRKITTITNLAGIPGFSNMDLLCGVAHLETGALRTSYTSAPHELLWRPVTEMTFAEPLKYVVTTPAGGAIQIGLPLTAANGPVAQILFFLRRKDALAKYSDWTNYSATLREEKDAVWNPERPLLQRAQLLVGTAVWADEDELWWRTACANALPGGIRAAGGYVYGYNFAAAPAEFSPSGSVNASRVDMRLNLTVSPPGGAADGEWSVHVFLLAHNWMRFQNGLANWVFMD